MHGPQLPFSQALHARKYRSEGESFTEAMARVAHALQDDAHHSAQLLEILLQMRFLPGGRIQSAMGATHLATPYNCYVSGTIADSLVDGEGAIMDRAKESAATMRLGGGIGYDFSTLRPRGDPIRKLQSTSSGPVSFMPVFDAIGKCVASSGYRRGAQIGVLRVDHPDIELFLQAKQPAAGLQPLWAQISALPQGAQRQQRIESLQATLPLSGFNLSVAISDEFMQALSLGRAFALRFNGRSYREVDARELWEKIMRSTWEWAEPGVLFIDTINRMNNLWYCETIVATNPCGEQPLPPFGSCLLGSFNLVRYLRRESGSGFTFEWEQLRADIPPVVRAMDNVVDRARHPLPRQQSQARQTRRMGLGVTGLANAAEALGFAYGSPAFLAFEAQVLELLRDESYLASTQLAQEKGVFPLFDSGKYLAGPFIQTLREDVRAAISRHGMRNSHLTSIAPTGTISLCADNVSSGIEPVFAHRIERSVAGPDGARIETIEDYGVRELGVYGKTVEHVSVDEHITVLTTAAQRVDAAVSKTCNIPAGTRWDDFKEVYRQAWGGGAKGCSTFRVGGYRAGILTADESCCQHGQHGPCG